MKFKSGFVSILGQPNAGKSTFLNFILQEDLAIVSEKAQATRKSCRGIYNKDRGQLIFLDAPGLVPEKKGLWTFLHKEFHKTLTDGDFILFIISNDQNLDKDFLKIINTYKDKKNWGVVWSKSDLKTSSDVLDLKSTLKPTLSFEFSIKTTKLKSLYEFFDQIIDLMPESDSLHFDDEWLTDMPLREIVADKIREQCFSCLEKELPYGTAVIINSFKENEGKKNLTKIEATIVLDKENHKSIVIGKGGAKLKEIGSAARKSIEKFLNTQVYLGLHVSVKKDWQNDARLMKELGYEHTKK